MPDHIYKPFDAELGALKDQVLAMGGLVRTHIAEAMLALGAPDSERALHVIEGDRAVNQLELAIDEQCVRMLALRQPAASDLRFIAATLKIVTDLERIGDIAVNMAERAQVLAGEAGPVARAEDLARMADVAQGMLKDTLEAFVSGDVTRAEAVVDADDQVDEWLVGMFEDLKAEMHRDPATINGALQTIFFAKLIERLADHTTNVAEMVVYTVRGQDIRHRSKL